jgi:hypothetical protein
MYFGEIMVFYTLFYKKIPLFLLLSILSLMVFICVGYFVKQSPNPNKTINKIQNKIIQKDAATILTLENISSLLNKRSDSIFHKFIHLESKYDTDGLIFLIYKNDSLIYWSNNLAPLESISTNSLDGIVFTENAWYRKLNYIQGSYKIVGLYLIKTAFVYQNEYLINSFHKSFCLKNDVNLSTSKSSYSIYSTRGDFLFSLEFPNNSKLTSNQTYLLLFLFLILMSLFLWLIYEIHLWYFRKKKNLFLLIFGFLTNVILFRFLIFYYKIPGILYSSDLFSPKYYAYSDYLPSIGDFFINGIILFLSCIFLFKSIKYNFKYQILGIYLRSTFLFLIFTAVILLFYLLIFTFESLIIDSNVSTDLNNIFSINQTSVLVFLIFTVLTFSFFIITTELCYIAFKLSANSRYIISAGSVGQPRDDNREAGYLIYDTDNDLIIKREIQYNVDSTIEKIKAAGLPLANGSRLLKPQYRSL